MGNDEDINVVDDGGDPLVDVGWYTSLSLDSNGNPVISYHDFTNGYLKLAHCNDPNCVGNDEDITVVDDEDDPSDNVGWYTSLALDSYSNPVISYHDVTNGNLKLVRISNINFIKKIDGLNDNVGEYSSLLLDFNGNPVISYYDVTNTNLKLTHCNDPNCVGNDEVISVVDDGGGSGGDVGRFTSLKLDSNGNPVISYYDVTNEDLKLVHCNDPNCVGNDEDITVVDDGGGSGDDVGRYTSLSLDSNGNPVISYHDFTNTNLKLVHCNDPNCMGNDEDITVVDNVGNIGLYTSLKLDSNGNPVISYYDETNNNVKLASYTIQDESLLINDKEGITGLPSESNANEVYRPTISLLLKRSTIDISSSLPAQLGSLQ